MKRRALVLVLLASGATGIACFGDLISSVHFNSTSPDLTLPPSPLVIRTWEETETRAVSVTPFGSEDYDGAAAEAAYERRKRIDDELEAAQKEVLKNASVESLNRAAKAARAKVELDEDGVESARTRAEAFEIAAKAGGSAWLTGFLQMRTLLDEGRAKEALQVPPTLPKTLVRDPLSTEVAYLSAIALWEESEDTKAIADAFTSVAADKASPRRAPALMMVARTLLQPQEAPMASVVRAEKTLDQLEKEFPKSRFHFSVVGWRGRAYLRRGDTANALVQYLRQLDTASDPEQLANATASIRLVINRVSANDAQELRKLMQKEPGLLRPYLDYRVHHTNLTAASLKNLFNFAQSFGKGATDGVSGDVHAYMAEAALVAGDTVAAQREATAAAGTASSRKDLAYYVLGGLALRKGNLGEAQGHFARAATYPTVYGKGAKEPLALIYERQEQWGKALDIYYELNYGEDIAWLLDARMKPEAIAEYAAKQTGARADSVNYALGMRYLRNDSLEKAETLFADLGVRRKALAEPGSKDYAWSEEDPTKIDILYDPLETVRDLKKLRAAVAGSEGDVKAAALYELASYYYSRRNLLLYNADLWKGGRSFMLGYFWNRDVASEADRARRTAHAYEHECLAKARAICLQIIKEFPNAPTTPKAYYRAATAERRLADFSPQWRDISKYGGNLWRAAAGHLNTLATKFPNDELAKNAKKYAKVFEEEAGDNWKAALSGPESRMEILRWNEGRETSR